MPNKKFVYCKLSSLKEMFSSNELSEQGWKKENTHIRSLNAIFHEKKVPSSFSQLSWSMNRSPLIVISVTRINWKLSQQQHQQKPRIIYSFAHFHRMDEKWNIIKLFLNQSSNSLMSIFSILITICKSNKKNHDFS